MSWPTDQAPALPLDAFDLRFSRYRLQGDDATHQAMVASLRRFDQLSPVVVWLQGDDVVLIDGFKRRHAGGVAPSIDHLTARVIEADETSAKAAMCRMNCLANTADTRVLRHHGKTPLEAFAEEQSCLLNLPEKPYDTALVIYRDVDVEGYVTYQNNVYSVPWGLVGQTLAVRVLEDEFRVYDGELRQVAAHELLGRDVNGGRRTDPSHRPSPSGARQLEQLRQRYAELGEVAERFLEGLLTARYGRDQARKALALLSLYHRRDVLAAMDRATRYRAFSLSALERILGARAKPKTPAQSLTDSYRSPLDEQAPVGVRSTCEYQPLLSNERDDEQQENGRPILQDNGANEDGQDEDGQDEDGDG